MRTLDEQDLPLWLIVALKELGTQEWRGAAHNPRILEYLRESRAGGDSDEIPWCACFVNWCLAQCDIVHPRSRAASSYRAYGVACGPIPGAIAFLPPGDPDAGGTGHVAFLWSVHASKIRILGGNQSNRVSLAYRPRREGIEYRWPPGVPLPLAA